MIAELLERGLDPAAELDLKRLTAEHVRKLRASARALDRSVVSRAEDAVRRNPEEVFLFDSSGCASLSAAGSRWSAGRFTTPSLADLKNRANASDGETRLFAFDGISPATDIGALQASTPGRPLFQVASQFNCLEAPGPALVSVANYFSDPTQGPRAAISAFPATLLRHYAAPSADGDRFVQQTGGKQIDLLTDAFAPNSSPVRNGYLTHHGALGGETVASVLDERFDQIRTGLHEEAAVLRGYDWDGAVDTPERRITQSFNSTVAGGGYGGEHALAPSFEPVCRLLLRAAYLGTLLAAVNLRRSPVVLTLIGGGAFGNPMRLIWESLLWAFDEVQPMASGSLDVIVNGRSLNPGHGPGSILADTRARGGAIFRFDHDGLASIER
jgi:hypothetical protein